MFFFFIIYIVFGCKNLITLKCVDVMFWTFRISVNTLYCCYVGAAQYLDRTQPLEPQGTGSEHMGLGVRQGGNILVPPNTLC